MTTTVLVTGATGFIAKHIVLQLLEAGHRVVGSARSLERDEELRSAIGPHLSDKALLENLTVVALDLSNPSGWDAAMTGVDVLMHTASPFPLVQPKDEQETIKPATEGVKHAFEAARKAGIKRIILTSSTVAITTGNTLADKSAFDEEDWANLDSPAATPYVKSKTLAEQVAWDYAKADPDLKLTVINPGFVIGPPLDQNYGASIQVIERILRGKDPMLPRFGFFSVDVRDIALMHVKAVERDQAIGERILGVKDFIWYHEMAETLAESFPDKKIPTRIAPDFVIRILALFDPAVRSIVPILGKKDAVSNEKARKLLEMEFRDIREATRASGRFILKHDLV